MRLGNEFKKGSLATLILSLLAEGPAYGYRIAREIERRSGGYFTVKEGTLYPALHKLELEGLIAAEWRMAGQMRRRRYYTLTEKGCQALRDATSEWRLFAQHILALLGRQPEPSAAAAGRPPASDQR